MLTYEPARMEQYEEFLQLLRSEVKGYLERTIELMQMTWEEFARLFKTQGQVEGIYQDGQLAGFYWFEERGQILHLHGLIAKEQFRGQGIGTQTLEMLAIRYKTGMTTIELGVQRSNEHARRLYERLGLDRADAGRSGIRCHAKTSGRECQSGIDTHAPPSAVTRIARGPANHCGDGLGGCES